MTTKLTKQLLGADSYISPEIRTVEFKAEGMLCTSTLLQWYDRADYNYGFNPLDEI